MGRDTVVAVVTFLSGERYGLIASGRKKKRAAAGEKACVLLLSSVKSVGFLGSPRSKQRASYNRTYISEPSQKGDVGFRI